MALLGVLVVAAVPTAGGAGGRAGLAALTAGTLLLDVAMQSGMAANQTRIWALRSEVRGRLNTAHTTCAYLGGTLGSWLRARAYTHLGRLGVCALLALLGTAPTPQRPAAGAGETEWSGTCGRRVKIWT